MMHRARYGVAAAGGCIFGGLHTTHTEQIRKFTKLEVIKATQETADVKRVTFRLPDGSATLGFSPISAVMIKANIEGSEKPVMKPYNPVFHSTPGEFSVCVKRYPEGKMGTAVHALSPGDHIDVKFGWQQFDYTPNKFSNIGCIAGGTGVTPMLQLIECIVKNPEDTTQVTLVFANKSDRDIFCMSQLDSLAAAHDQLTVVYTVEEKTGWFDQVELGRVSDATIQKHMPAPEAGTMIFVCGKSGMVKELAGPKIFEKGKSPQQGPLLGVLKSLGFSEANVTKV